MFSHCISIAVIAVCSLIACNKIKSGNELHRQETNYIRQLGLLDDHEQIIKFYSNYKFRNAGNFFTEKRIAKYWIDKKDSSKTEITYALYNDILSIDSTTAVPSTHCPYLLITRKDSTRFKVFVNGKQTEVKNFFAEAIHKWAQHQSLALLPHQAR